MRDPKDVTKKKKNWKKTILTILGVILALLLLVVAVAGVFVGRWLNLINKTDGTANTLSSSELDAFWQENTDATDPNFTGEHMDPEDVTWDTTPVEIEQGSNIINILLVGVDDEVQGGGYVRSDVTILCTLNKAQKTLTLTSFMRDLYVRIPGYGSNRINVAYTVGGLPLLRKTLELNFGVQVDGCFVVNFDGFKDVIDTIGGVTIRLNEAEVNYMRQGHFMNDFAGSQESDLDYVVGENLLNGAQALVYARMRKIDSDFNRTQRQRNVLTAIFNKCKKMSPGQLYNLMETVLPMLTTDMDNITILDYAAQTMPLLPDLKLETQRIPVDGGYRDVWVGNMLVLMPDLETNRKVLSEILTDEKLP